MIAPLVLLGVAVACSRTTGSASIVSDSTFVATIAALRQIEISTTLDSTARDSARAATLRRFGLTADELERMARAMAADPGRALAVWRAIEQRSTSERAPTAP